MPEQFEYEGRDLEAMSFAQNYHAWIRDEFAPFVRGDVAEVGAGDGAFSTMLLECQPRSLTLFEPSARMFEQQGHRLGATAVRRVNATFSERADEFIGALDSLLYVNVLEHIEDDAHELALAHAALRPGGYLCIFVPALPALMSSFDRRIGHHRRYTRTELQQSLSTAGFTVERLHYFDGLGILPWFAFMTLGGGGLSAGAVSVYDRRVVPALRMLETRVRPWLGKNLLAIARRP